jgi:hypothetical protein
MKRSRTRQMLVALIAPVAMIAAANAPAAAASDTAAVVSAAAIVVQGSGQIDPPLGVDPIGHNFYFLGTATITGLFCGATYLGSARPIAANGIDIAGSVAEGAGLLTVDIGGCVASGAFIRVGPVVVVALATPTVTAATAVCGFVPTPLTPPVTYFSADCVGAFVR